MLLNGMYLRINQAHIRELISCDGYGTFEMLKGRYYSSLMKCYRIVFTSRRAYFSDEIL